MGLSIWPKFMLTGALALLSAAIPSAARAPQLAMLSRLDKGTWEIRDRSNGYRQRICLRTGHELIQLRHRQPNCSEFIVQDAATEVTVQYTCRGNDYGRTTIRRESSGLVQIRSQGILNGTPFSLEGEGRLQGKC